jgi:hypothetical protein
VTLAKYYYGTQPFLAWVLNHYFYNRIHYVYLGAPFFPYKQNNPASSDPYHLYQAFYKPFKDRDNYDIFIGGYRNSLKRGVDAKITNKQSKNTLKKLCEEIGIEFFYLIVYRVDISYLEPERLIISGSGRDVNSKEYLVRDLQETEFDLLFVDFEHENLSPDFHKLCYDSISQAEAFNILKANTHES